MFLPSKFNIIRAMMSVGAKIFALPPNMVPQKDRHGRTILRGDPTRWKTTYHVPHGKRERERRQRQHGYANQVACHKSGTVQPRHIFGGNT